MAHISKQDKEVLNEIDEAAKLLNVTEKSEQLADLRSKMQQEDFWNDSNKAQSISKQEAKLASAIEPWLELKKDRDELEEFIAMDDDSLTEEIQQKLASLAKTFEGLKHELKFSGQYDNYDAIITIHAGAGGTDAQDWAEMLFRMYGRWAENTNLSVELIHESLGDEAGLKSVSFSVSGKHAYGLLKSEHGVHRLVRQSPFNSAASRETSFAMVEVVPQIDEPSEIGIDEQDLKIDVFRAGGHGGQSVNTTDSAVRITHIPTNIVVSIQNERSQTQNKDTAMKVLRSKLAALAQEQHQEKISELKGPNQEAAWGNQIRNYVLHPYKLVKDVRTEHQESDVDAVLNGKIEPFIEAYLEQTLGQA